MKLDARRSLKLKTGTGSCGEGRASERCGAMENKQDSKKERRDGSKGMEKEEANSREQKGNDQNANDDNSQSDPSAPVIPSRVFVVVALTVDDSIASLALC